MTNFKNKNLNYLPLFILLTFLNSCNIKEVPVKKEPWIEKPVSDWPELVMTNTVEFADTTYNNIVITSYSIHYTKLYEVRRFG